MYPLVLSLHNIIRWVALILGIVATVMALMGWFGRRKWSDADRRWGSFFGIALDIQVLLGLILFLFLSPITRGAFSNLGAAMSVPDTRFFVVEHTVSMFLAVVLAHMGSALARRVPSANAKYQRLAIFFGLAVLLILVGMPWMRPLFRLG